MLIYNNNFKLINKKIKIIFLNNLHKLYKKINIIIINLKIILILDFICF